MIDHIRIATQVPVLPEVLNEVNESFAFGDVVMDPQMINGKVRKYVGQLDGMRVELRGDRLAMSNSLCKFLKGNNIDNMTYAEHIEAIGKLESTFDIPATKWKVQSMEYGLVLERDPMQEVSTWTGVGKVRANDMKNARGMIFGREIVRYESYLKGYDKVKEFNLRNPQVKLIGQGTRFRIEKGVRRMRHLNRGTRMIGLSSLDDLKDKGKLKALGDDLVSAYTEIDKIPAIDYAELSTSDLKRIGIFTNPELREGYRRTKRSTYRHDLTWYNGWKRTIKNEVPKLIKSEWSKLTA